MVADVQGGTEGAPRVIREVDGGTGAQREECVSGVVGSFSQHLPGCVCLEGRCFYQASEKLDSGRFDSHRGSSVVDEGEGLRQSMRT